MASLLRLYVDVQNRALVTSTTSTVKTTLPTLVQDEAPDIQLFFLDPEGGTSEAPYKGVGLSGAGISLALMAGVPIGGQNTIIASNSTWYGVTGVSGNFQGTLNLSTAGISNALGNAATLDCTAEIQFTEYGQTRPVKCYQGATTIKASVIKP
jgi:hypothetical protein